MGALVSKAENGSKARRDEWQSRDRSDRVSSRGIFSFGFPIAARAPPLLAESMRAVFVIRAQGCILGTAQFSISRTLLIYAFNLERRFSHSKSGVLISW
jgi:hypothetical protein